MKIAVIAVGLVTIIVTVIVVNAPPDSDALSDGAPIPIETVFTILEGENDAVRKLWTEEIVGLGQERGLRFDDHWRDPEVEAGPLPALFLREVAEKVTRDPVPLYLFLGSNFPINDANKFTGLQSQYFGEIEKTSMPQFFLDDDIQMHTGMFSDVAVAETCITCHNNDPESAKRDWKVGDIMGATTWSYPKGEVSLHEALTLVEALRQGVIDAYEEYVTKAATFADPPTIGEKWPADGYFLPSVDAFFAEAELRASARTMRLILEFQRAPEPQQNPEFQQEQK